MAKVTVNPFGVQPVAPATIPLLREDLIALLQQGLNDFTRDAGMAVAMELLKDEALQRCGARYSHGADDAYRHGKQDGYIVLGGQKRPLKRPRMRSKAGGEVKLDAYERLQSPEALPEAVLRRMMVHVSCRDYPQAIELATDAVGVKRSSVSRHFKTASAAQLRKLTQRNFKGRSFRVIFIDGKDYSGSMLLAALGLEDLNDRAKDGKKAVLGIRHGSTENAEVCVALLQDLQERGLDLNQPILWVVDGSKALASAIRRVCGWNAVIQRCRVHKRRNVLSHLQEEYHDEFSRRYREALQEPYDKAFFLLKGLVRWLESKNPDAASSLEEGLPELLTVSRLGLPSPLTKTLGTTNPLESAFSVAEEATRRVKRWRAGDMRLRWFASAMLAAENRFRRVRGCMFFAQLVAELEKEVAKRRELELKVA